MVRPSFRLLAALVALFPFALGGLPAQAPDRAKEIAEIEKQIAELNRKLKALKEAPAQLLPDSWTKNLNWRSIGPASMGGRIVAFAVCDSDPSTFWVATASGGLLKTTNNGNTFEHQFDREATVSIGDVAVAPSNKDIVWVGTGEHNPRNSVSYGDGVYKSVDGGMKWANMGLKKSFQIGRIVIHPKDPNIVYVGALGRLYGPSEERGLYKTEDGGKSWKKILHVDNDTGVIEMKMSPADPNVLLVATWERRRDAFDSHAGAVATAFQPDARLSPPLADGYDAYDPIRKWGKGSALYRTADGGKSWNKATKGLPGGQLGRIGLDFYKKDPRVVFAIVDCDQIGKGTPSGYLGIGLADDKMGARATTVAKGSPAEKGGLKANDVITSVNGKPVKNSEGLLVAMSETKPGDRAALEVSRGGKAEKLTVVLGERPLPGGGGPARRALDFAAAPAKDGLRVTAMQPRGPAARAGLQVEDVITAVDGKPIGSFRAFADKVRAAPPETKFKLAFLRGKVKKEGIYSLSTRRPSTRPFGSVLGGQRENEQWAQGPNSHQYGGLYRSDDAGQSWRRVNSINPRPMYFSQVRVDPSDDKRVYVLGIRLHISEDGGKSFRPNGFRIVHDDAHAMWVDHRDGRHILLGTDGGTYSTYDRCQHWDYLNTTAIGQFYHVCVDSRRPYNVYGGMQDNGSWGGPSRGLDGRGPVNSDWRFVGGGDGFVCRVDPQGPDVVYSEAQDGNVRRRNVRTGEETYIRPVTPKGEAANRFNWNTPFILSSHNPQVVYVAGNRVFRSLKRGEQARPISPELCKSSQASATALAESPRNGEVLWVGTDDGQLWLSRDGGGKWDNVTAKLGVGKPFCVATIEPSRAVEGRAYVCLDAHRSNDDDPYLFVTEDFGQTWKPLRGNLPSGSSRCLREDLFNPDVLYLGTEFAVWASIDRGATWTRINNNLPTVAVHELAQHPTSGEIVAATHGRSIWVLDVTPLRQLKAATIKDAATLLVPNTVVRWRTEAARRTIYGIGNREFFGENPAPGAHVFYALTKKAEKASLTIEDVSGKVLATLPVSKEPGLHRATWNLRTSATAGLGFLIFSPPDVARAARRSLVPVPAGSYRVVLKVGDQEMVKALKVENDPTLKPGTAIAGPAEAGEDD